MTLSEGIIIGCDNNQEWLLPWFWDSYSAHNNYSVTFMDFGMTDRGRAFCNKRGDVISVPFVEMLEVPQDRARSWETVGQNGFWHSRPKWFCKPLAFALCPYAQGLWLDLDCKVHGSLQPLFTLLGADDIALVKEPEVKQTLLQNISCLLPGQVSYNSGVVVFKKDSQPIKLWQKEALFHNNRHRGDQEALNFILYLYDVKVKELPIETNWLMTFGDNPKALISHYATGKEKIRLIKEMKKELWPQVEDLLQSVNV